MKIDIINKLEELIGAEHVVRDADMAKYTSFRAGGKAAALVEPQTVDQLKAVLQLIAKEGCQHMVIGNGSNLLVKDSGYDGVFVKLGKPFDYADVKGEKVICGCAT
ncbi:MAG: FAD-binding protein, partial [Eubacterium sp.]|nr:FAD-binding protein [Candidatus Colimonas fimequi]